MLVIKYADHLPLYRQCLIYKRTGVDLARSTLSEWIGQCGMQLEPLAQALKQIILQQYVVIHAADETPMTVMQIGENKPKKGYVWAYATTQTIQRKQW